VIGASTVMDGMRATDSFRNGKPPIPDICTQNHHLITNSIFINLSTLPAVCGARSMQRSGVRLSVSSVCPIDRQQQRRPAGLLLSACRQKISIASCVRGAGAVLQAPCCGRRRSAANAGSIVLTADDGGSTHTGLSWTSVIS